MSIKPLDSQLLAKITNAQNLCRGRLARKEFKQIKESKGCVPLVVLAWEYLKNPEKLSYAPHPSCGKNFKNIYLPSDIPVVIRFFEKREDAVNGLRRFENMGKAQSICDQHQLNSLTVPRAAWFTSSYGCYIVEDRLPNPHDDYFKAMAEYYENQEAYTPIVKDFTLFLRHGYLGDIAGRSRHWINHIGTCKDSVPRFDNLMLYTTECDQKIRKLALIDLEAFLDYKANKKPEDIVALAIFTCTTVFPYHFEVARDTGNSICASFNKTVLPNCITHIQKARKLYDLVYNDNLSFYKHHQITPENQVLVLNPDSGKLQNDICKFLSDNHKKSLPIFRVDYDQTLDEAKELFKTDLCPQMVEYSLENLQNHMINRLSETCNVSNNGELIGSRSLFGPFTQSLVEHFNQNAKNLITQIFSPDFDIHDIFEEFFQLLVRYKTIAYYETKIYPKDEQFKDYSNHDVIFF